MRIEQAANILALIVAEASALPRLGSGPRRTLGERAAALGAQGDRAREIAPWVSLGSALSLTEAEMAGAEPAPAVETEDQAAEILSLVRDRMDALRHQLDESIPIDETDHYALMAVARRMAERAAVLRMLSVVTDALGDTAAEGEAPTALTAAQRRELLDRAVAAVRLLRGGTQEAQEVARLAVTDAVARAGYDHLAVASATGLTGLDVSRLIADWDARGLALGAERQAAADHVAEVRRECAAYARQRRAAEGESARGRTAKLIGVTGPAVDAWVAEQAGEPL